MVSVYNVRIGSAGLEALVLMLGGEEGTINPKNMALREIKLVCHPHYLWLVSGVMVQLAGVWQGNVVLYNKLSLDDITLSGCRMGTRHLRLGGSPWRIGRRYAG